MMIRRLAFVLLFLLTACQPAIPAILIPAAVSLPTQYLQPTLPSSPTIQLSSTSVPTGTSLPGKTPIPSVTFTPSPGPLPASLNLDPAKWKSWPVIPAVPEHARQIYQLGQALGNDPHAFSVFGDCQSEPDVFMGVYETDPELVAALPADLQETVAWFEGSFNRESPTVRSGTTAGALLWPTWHQNMYTCTLSESPLQCELRIHKPAFVIIHVGTHYESRNDVYMGKVLDQLIAAGVVPILATKADDRELDEHINAGYAQLAVEYAIPFWNFWAAVNYLPNHGLYTRPDRSFQGDIYLTDSAMADHRWYALLMLDAVRRAVMEP
jgi:hypothetical protein